MARTATPNITAMMAIATSNSIKVKPASETLLKPEEEHLKVSLNLASLNAIEDLLPIANIGIVSGSARFAICAKAVDIDFTMRAWVGILVRVAPWILWNGI